MRSFFSLLKKDFENFRFSFLPSILMGLPLFLILGFGNEIEFDQNLSWRSAFWLSFFISVANLFYRSFSQEHQNSNFQVYRMLKIPRIQILLSQSIIQALQSMALGLIYCIMAVVFFRAPDFDFAQMLTLIFLASICLALPGSFLGLFLQFEREFLFALFFLPLATPVILACHSLSLQPQASWLYALGIFLLLGGFLSLFLFEFFFDELT